MVLLLFPGCEAINAQTWQDSVVVLPIKTEVPAGAKKIGTLNAGNNAVRNNCDYDGLIVSVKEKARKMGGNIVKITEVIEPTFISKCYKIRADVYYADKMPAYSIKKTIKNKTLIPDNKNCAMLYIYRLKDTLALVTSYNVHLNDDSVICSVKSKSRDSIKLKKEGTITLWAKTEKRTELKLDVKPGHTYYIRCGLEKGEIRMVPVLQLMDKTIGAEEYERLRKKGENTSVNYLHQVH
jgi:hypothetical protein